MKRMPYLVRFKSWVEGEPEPVEWDYSRFPSVFYSPAIAKSVFYKNIRVLLESVHTVPRNRPIHLRIQLIDRRGAEEKVIEDRLEYVPPLRVPDRVKPFSSERSKEWEERMKRFQELKSRLGIKTYMYSLLEWF